MGLCNPASCRARETKNCSTPPADRLSLPCWESAWTHFFLHHGLQCHPLSRWQANVTCVCVYLFSLDDHKKVLVEFVLRSMGADFEGKQCAELELGQAANQSEQYCSSLSLSVHVPLCLSGWPQSLWKCAKICYYLDHVLKHTGANMLINVCVWVQMLSCKYVAICRGVLQFSCNLQANCNKLRVAILLQLA